MLRLAAASAVIHPGLTELIFDLGDGESGFGGTGVPSGETTLQQYVERCRKMTDPANLPPHLVPQTTFWAIDDAGEVVGMARVRHYLNDRLRVRGGHIGYFVRRDRRGRGYGPEILHLALRELQRLGNDRALLTVSPENVPSIRVILANGGRFHREIVDAKTGDTSRLYWIETDSSADPAAK